MAAPLRIPTIPLAVAATAVVAEALRRYIASRRRARLVRQAQEGGYECADLTDLELECAGGDNPSTVANIFKGQLGDEQVAALHGRVSAVVRANPWLCGRLAPSVDPGRHVAIFVPPHGWEPSDAEVSQLVHVVDEPRLAPGVSVHEANTLLYKHDIGGGSLRTPVGKTLGPVFAVTAVRGSKGACAVVVALSHTAGDAWTLYKVHRMVAGVDPVVPLSFSRGNELEPNPTLTTMEAALMVCAPGRARHTPHSTARGLPLALPLGLPACAHLTVPQWMVQGPGLRVFVESLLPWAPWRNEGELLELDLEALDAAKKAHEPSAGAPFISTLDVATSTLFQHMHPDVCVYSVGLRGRFAGYTETQAGNHLTCLVSPGAACYTPGGVRAKLSAISAGNAAALDLANLVPGLPRSLGWRMGVVTSWCFGDTTFHLPGCQAVGHFPTHVPGRTMPRFAILFTARPGVLAAHAALPDKASDAALRREGIVKGPLQLAW